MKIALIHSSLSIVGGAEKQLLMLANELQKRGHNVDIFVFDYNKNCYEDLCHNLNIIVLESRLVKICRIIGNIITNMIGIFKPVEVTFFQIPLFDIVLSLIASLCIPNGYDVINCHNLPSQWVAVFYKLFKNRCVPIVWMYNDVPKNTNTKFIIKFTIKKLNIYVVKYIDKIVVLDKFNINRLINLYKREGILVRSGLTLSSFLQLQSNKIRKKYGIKDSEKVILVVGRLVSRPERKIEEVILACKQLHEKMDNIKLVIVGTGEKLPKLKELVKRLNFEKNVIFAGYVPEKELPLYYSACDIFIFPVPVQTWGLVVFEAMASKKPALLSIYVGAAEVLKDKTNCVFLKRLDADEIAEKIYWLLTEPKHYKRISVNGFKYVVNNISWEKYAESMEKIFYDVLKSK